MIMNLSLSALLLSLWIVVVDVVVVSAQELSAHTTSVSVADGVGTVDFEVIPGDAAVRITLTRTTTTAAATDGGLGWMAVGSSPDGVMFGTTACIGLTSGQTPELYDIGQQYSRSAIALSTTQNLMEGSSFTHDEDEGISTLVCRIPLDLPEGQFAFTSQPDESSSFVVAWGDSDTLQYHGGNGRFPNLSVVLQPTNETNDGGATDEQGDTEDSFPEPGDEVCIEGHVMDFYCINRGTLLDKSSIRTLSPEGPLEHTVHCLIDVDRCVNSPFEILLPPLPDAGNEDYVRGWRLDGDTQDTIVALAKAQGICGECDGTGEIRKGFHVSVTTATVLDAGDENRPPRVTAASGDDVVVVSSPDDLRCPRGSARPAPFDVTEDDADTTTGNQDDETDGDLELASGLNLGRTVSGDEVTFVLTYEGEAWVALAVSPSGQMVGAQAVIGLPDSGQDPMIYDLNARALSGVEQAEEQVLTSSSVVQQDGVTTLTFTVPLETEGYFVAATGETSYLFAYGTDNELGYHGRRSPFSAGLVGDASLAEDPTPYYKAHGWLMALAWGLLCPLAIAASLLRDVFPPGMFFQIHRALNSSVVILTVVAFGLVVRATNMENLDHFSEVGHRKLGLVIFILAVLQATNGFLRPHVPHAPSNSNNSADASSNNQSDNKGNTGQEEAKSTARKVWEIGHRLFGFGILAMAWANCTTGIDQFSLKFPDESSGSTATTVFWVIVVVISAASLVSFAVIQFKKRT